MHKRKPPTYIDFWRVAVNYMQKEKKNRAKNKINKNKKKIIIIIICWISTDKSGVNYKQHCTAS